MNKADLTMHKADLIEALSRFESSIRIRSIQVIDGGRIMVIGNTSNRIVFYIYEDGCWVQK